MVHPLPITSTLVAQLVGGVVVVEGGVLIKHQNSVLLARELSYQQLMFLALKEGCITRVQNSLARGRSFC